MAEAEQPGHWQGVVKRLDARIDPISRTFQAFVVVDNAAAGQALVPGAFVRVTIDGPRYPSAITIPRIAMRNSHVFVANGGRADFRMVKVERYVGELALIKTGLKAGEKVILTNLDRLQDGTMIDHVARTEPASARRNTSTTNTSGTNH